MIEAGCAAGSGCRRVSRRRVERVVGVAGMRRRGGRRSVPRMAGRIVVEPRQRGRGSVDFVGPVGVAVGSRRSHSTRKEGVKQASKPAGAASKRGG